MLLDLDKTDTAVLKGLAISSIVLHNYFHFIGPVHQNEFSFQSARFWVFVAQIRHPSLAIQAFFSFFGHFGVQIFIFLSAYGLARSYWDNRVPWTTFMAGRLKKLYPAFGLVVIPWAVACSLLLGPLAFLKQAGLEVVLMLAGVSTILPGYGLPPVGPWWFIPFILQLYAVWFLLRMVTMRFGCRGLVALSLGCLVLTQLANPVLARWSINLLTTPIGRTPDVCFGIVAARYPVRIRARLALAAGAVLILGSFYAPLWPLTFLSALVLALWLYTKCRRSLRAIPFLHRIGHYSLFIFLVNGIVRDQFVDSTRTVFSQLVFAGLSAATSFAIAAAISEFLLPRKDRSAGLESAVMPAEFRPEQKEHGCPRQGELLPLSIGYKLRMTSSGEWQ